MSIYSVLAKVFICWFLLGALTTVNARDFSVGIELPTQVSVTPALEVALRGWASITSIGFAVGDCDAIGANSTSNTVTSDKAR